MNQLHNRFVLITGGSNGIGLELAKVFARTGNNLFLVARSETKLKEVSEQLQQQYGITCLYLVLDLSEARSAEKLFIHLYELGITIDVLINNAGFGTWGEFYTIDIEKELQEMQLNIVTLVHLTKLFAQEMIKRGGGKILNVSSTAGYQPGPLMAIYYASKAFVTSFSEALHEEMNSKGITITVLCPGPTATNFQTHAGMAKMHLFRQLFIMKPDVVAEAAYAGLMKGERVVIPGLLNKLTAFINRLLPKVFVLKIVRMLHERRG